MRATAVVVMLSTFLVISCTLLLFERHFGQTAAIYAAYTGTSGISGGSCVGRFLGKTADTRANTGMSVAVTMQIPQSVLTQYAAPDCINTVGTSCVKLVQAVPGNGACVVRLFGTTDCLGQPVFTVGFAQEEDHVNCNFQSF
jgi:hypothetical protein